MTDFDKNYVFISVCSEDLPRVEPILQKLGEKGLNYWVYEVGGKKIIQPGEKWRAELNRCIRSCHAFFAFLSKSYFSHGVTCTDELNNYHNNPSGGNLVPIKLDENIQIPDDIDFWITQIHGVDVVGLNNDDIVKELLRAKGVSECIYKESSKANVENISGKHFQEAVVKVGCKILYRVGGLQEKEPRRYLLGVVKTISNGDIIEIETNRGDGTKINKSFSIGIGIDRKTLSLKLEDYHKCPMCQYYIKKEEEMCGTCFATIGSERINIIKQYFREHVKDGDKPYQLNDEQLGCLITNQNTLIEARAGSGKTRTLVAKIIDLVARQGLRANEFLSFCFNRNARVEIQDRLFEKCKVDEKPVLDEKSVKNAIHTFHSFSFGALKGVAGLTLNNILFDKKDELITKIIEFLYDNKPDFSSAVMSFFEQEFLTREGTRYESGDAFLDSIRYHSEFTMMHENVETAAEKHIADFLLENGLDYSYWPRINKKMKRDRKHTENNRNPCSCFKVGKSKMLTIEFWLCNGEETPEEKKRIETEFHINYNDHLEEKGKASNFWKVQDERCITLDNYTFSRLTKEKQQEVLGRKLSEAGFSCIKLTEDEIRKKVWFQWQDDFCKLIIDYINRYQTNYLNDDSDYARNLTNTADEKIKTFHSLAEQVYKRYLKILQNNNEGRGVDNGVKFSQYTQYLIDGNYLIYEATEAIQSGKLDERIQNLKWIFIDEFQDFSKLFYELIRSILDRNPKIKLFCVGDPWQAINRFAGSDVEYFDNFGKFFSESHFVKKYITNNYRSSKKIVCYANNFMERMHMEGKPSNPNPKENGDGFKDPKVIDIQREYAPCTKEGDEFFWAKNVNTALNAKAIRDFCEGYTGKRILILSRTKLFLGKGLERFQKVLKDNCKLEIDDISTVHVQKGSEADVVVIVNANKGGFPLFNSNELLFTPFEKDNNPKTVLRKAAIDEIKLYYVALTRAKEALCIIYDSAYPAPFIPKPKHSFF